MMFEKLVLGRSFLNSALLRVQQRPNFLMTRNKSSTTSSDEISDNSNSSRDKKKVETPYPENLTLTDIKYIWLHEKANYYEGMGGSGFCDYNEIKRKEGYSGVLWDLDWEDRKNLYPNGKWAKEFFKKKDISVETEKASFRKMYATFRLICKIEDIARRLVDENVIEKCHMFYHLTSFDKIHCFDESDYEECWTSLLKSSEVPLSVELKNQLKEANITESEFSKNISDIHMKLIDFDVFKCYQIEPVGREDIIDVLADLNLNGNSHKSIKILFNLDEPVKWRL